jgi:hypothetical protein
MTMVLNGATGITFPDTSVQAKSAQGPCFSAYAGASTSIGAGAIVKVAFSLKEFDLTTAFDNATNYRFTPLVAGYYQVNSKVSTNDATGYHSCRLNKNGAIYKSGPLTYPTASAGESLVSALVFLNGSTDYIEIFAYSSQAATISTGSDTTYFQACLMRAA